MTTKRRSLEELRQAIQSVRRGPYAHNVVSSCLRLIAERYGKKAANKAVRDFNLTKRYGIRPEPEGRCTDARSNHE
jgi:hypothetical protein